MLSFLPGPVRGVLAFLLYIANTAFWIGPLVLFSILKLIIPFQFWQYLSRIIIDFIATCWVDFNSFNLWLLQRIRIEARGLEALGKDMWYIVVSNHQSWVDILILQKLFLRKIPFLKFFLKQELIWVPLMGVAWWALDFPFMKRYSSSFLEKNPHLRGKDIEITRKACEKFKTIPVSIVNFMEGTRYTPEKHLRQQSPFSHLLKPKAGGIAFILGSMGDMVTGIVNVTIAYPEGAKSFWQFLCGQVRQVKVNVELIPVSEDIIGNYFEDEGFRERFQAWVNRLWGNKDKQLREMISQEN
ncbi:MAG: acyltransferase [Proteobacteria bacterium]|nr:acyltransferase [Pseudomonadota bacterium]